MRILLRSGPLLLALGIIWTGCSPSGDLPPKGASQPSPRTSHSAGDSGTKVANSDSSSASQVVLGIQGMT